MESDRANDKHVIRDNSLDQAEPKMDLETTAEQPFRKSSEAAESSAEPSHHRTPELSGVVSSTERETSKPQVKGGAESGAGLSEQADQTSGQLKENISSAVPAIEKTAEPKSNLVDSTFKSPSMLFSVPAKAPKPAAAASKSSTIDKLDSENDGSKAKMGDPMDVDHSKSPSSLKLGTKAEPSNSKSGFAFAMPKLALKTKHKSFEGTENKPSPEVNSKSKVKTDEKISEQSSGKTPTPPPLPYKEPSWSGLPMDEYHLEVLKNGQILSKFALSEKPYHVFGRLAACDMQLDHPSLSRYHFVLQYRPTGDGEHDPGFYAYDLGSTHGSFLNKQKMVARAFYRMKVGHMFKLGGSTRLFILQGPSEDEEGQPEMSVTELKELRLKQTMLMEEKKQRQAEELKEQKKMKKKEEEKPAGITWGMSMDDEEDEEADPDAENPFAMETLEEREAAYIKDPKKTLRGFFEREDVELEYEVDEKGSGLSHNYVCRVQLPLDDAMGKPIYAEATVSGKKKEAVVACALEACRILDRHGVLRQAIHESKKRKAKDWAQDDYYDSDDDTFLDRTGAVEKKRKQRMKKAGVLQEKAETYQSLIAKLAEVDAELKKTEEQLEEAKKAQPAEGSSDSLDDFIASLKAGGSSHDRAQRAKLKIKVVELKKEQFKIQKLVQLVQPASMPDLPKPKPIQTGRGLPMIGSIRSKSSFNQRFQPKIQIKPMAVKTEAGNEVEEEEEEEEEEDEEEEARAESALDADQHPSEAPRQGGDWVGVGGEGEGDTPTTSQSAAIAEAQPKRVYGVAMLPVSSNDGVSEEVTRKDRTKDTETTSRPQRMYGVAMPPVASNDGVSERASRKGESKEKEEEKETTSRPKKVYGPAMPPVLATAKPVKGPSRGPLKAGSMGGIVSIMRDSEAEKKEEEGMETGDYADWQPPTDQKGDGRTRLNERLGY